MLLTRHTDARPSFNCPFPCRDRLHAPARPRPPGREGSVSSRGRSARDRRRPGSRAAGPGSRLRWPDCPPGRPCRGCGSGVPAGPEERQGGVRVDGEVPAGVRRGSLAGTDPCRTGWVPAAHRRGSTSRARRSTRRSPSSQPGGHDHLPSNWPPAILAASLPYALNVVTGADEILGPVVVGSSAPRSPSSPTTARPRRLPWPTRHGPGCAPRYGRATPGTPFGRFDASGIGRELGR